MKRVVNESNEGLNLVFLLRSTDEFEIFWHLSFNAFLPLFHNKKTIQNKNKQTGYGFLLAKTICIICVYNFSMMCNQNNTVIIIANKIIQALQIVTKLTEICLNNFHHMDEISIIRIHYKSKQVVWHSSH